MYNNSSVGGKVVHYSMWKMSLICKLIGLGLTKHECWQGFCLSKPHMSERPVSDIFYSEIWLAFQEFLRPIDT